MILHEEGPWSLDAHLEVHEGQTRCKWHELNAHRGQTVFDTDAVPVVQAPDLQGSGEASLQVRVWSYVGGSTGASVGYGRAHAPRRLSPYVAFAR